MIRILFFGDVVGKEGTDALCRFIDNKRNHYNADFIVVNAENSNDNAKGPGVYAIKRLFDHKVDIITGGNHSFGNKFILDEYSRNPYFLRPANFPPEAFGSGCVIKEKLGKRLGVVNVQLRTFMREQLFCPFRSADTFVSVFDDKVDALLFDVHGEATSEKLNMGYFLDGKASAVLGTHTHVQTADERIFPKGTAYITDVGMCGPLHSSLGIRFEQIFHNFFTQMPVKYEVETEGPIVISGVVIDIEDKRALNIERIYHVE